MQRKLGTMWGQALDILFVHQNMPAQFKHLAPQLAKSPRYRTVFVTHRQGVELPGVRRVSYDQPKPAGQSTHQYVRQFEASVRFGQQTARALVDLKREGFDPAVIIGHPGWGEMLFVKDVFPRARVISYCEFYYQSHGADVGFDPDEPVDLDAICRTRARNAHLLLSLELADFGLSPTEWQRSRHPLAMQSKIHTIFDGVDCGVVKPNPKARFTLPNGKVLTRNDEVLTYVARNLEPYRGYPSFIRSLPTILAERPEVHVVIVGGDEVSYGKAPAGGKNWRETMEAEVALTTGPYKDRVHFTGKLPYARYLQLLQISSAHLYLTVPFVLSWSCMEAMAAGCQMVASDTQPVREVIEDGVNGHLVPMFDVPAIAARTVQALAERDTSVTLRKAARQTILDRYELKDCLRQHVRLVERAAEMRG